MADDYLNQQPGSAQDTGPTVQPEVAQLEVETVKLWTSRIKRAKQYFEEDFKRMKENMEFAAGLQWDGQEQMNDDRYVANFITHQTNQKVASLYARDPKAISRRRKRLDYQLWDGKIETLQGAAMAMQQSMMGGFVTPQAMQAQQVLADFQKGQQWEQLCEKVGKTIDTIYQYECDTQQPSFKYQMKQLVRRTVVTGVGFVRMSFIRDGDRTIASETESDSIQMRVKRAKLILSEIADDQIQEDDPRIEQARLLLQGLMGESTVAINNNLQESIEFDFPSATSIIVDPKCRSLKGFIGAEWIAQQYMMPLETANAYFETNIKTGGELIEYSEQGMELKKPLTDQPKDVARKPMGCFWELFDLTNKTKFVICDGWKQYVEPPASPMPTLRRFWPIFTLTFNDIEVEGGQKVRIYPPSDVQLLKPMQKERNRERQELRGHRKSNKPFYGVAKGGIQLTDADKDKLANHENSEVIEFEGVPAGTDINKAIGIFQHAPIDANVYNTDPYDQDAQLAVGSNQIQQQKPIRHVAATPAVIQEQARISDVNSNVDDLDDLLTELAFCGGEIILQEYSPQTAQRIAGIGAVLPEQNKQDFLNAIFLDHVAASSGRPNKAVEVANAQQLLPIFFQFGANPWACIQYLCKVLDSNIDPADFAPMIPPTPQGQPGQQQQPKQGLNQPGHPHPGNIGQHQTGQPMPSGVQQGGLH